MDARHALRRSGFEERVGGGGVVDLIPVHVLLPLSFWLFGTLVAMQFGVVVTAANDLTGNSAPPGLILFAYTLPSVLIRAFVPYIKFPDVSAIFSSPRTYAYSRIHTPGNISRPEIPGARGVVRMSRAINYAARLTLCAVASFLGLQLLAWADNVGIRVLGIGLASLSSNLGDMSFFQLTTRYPTMTSRSLGGYVAGSGTAGLIGSFAYTVLTASFSVSPSGVLSGIGLAPTAILLIYFFLLPTPAEVEQVAAASPRDVDAADVNERPVGVKENVIGSLKLSDRLRLVRPMIWGYMAPLATLMFLEITTTQGILPTILFTLPFPSNSTTFAPLLNAIFKTLRDFYPFFYTTYKFAIFSGRISITLFRIPGGNTLAYWALCLAELTCLLSLLYQSHSMADPTIPIATPDASFPFSPIATITLISTMGLCGGLGMSNRYWRVSENPLPPDVWRALDTARSGHAMEFEATDDSDAAAPLVGEDYFPRWRGSPPTAPYGAARSQEDETAVREFLISTIALPDTLAVMFASMVSMWLQPELCRHQVAAGRELCEANVV